VTGITRALLIIDIQRDYFPGGSFPLVEPEAAAENASRLLAAFRAAGDAVVHVQHAWDAPDAEYLKPGTPGFEIHDAVRPQGDEAVIQKTEPNAFVGTALAEQLRSRGVDTVVVAGMMSSMCVDATVRAAVDLGFAATVVHDACAAPDLEFEGETIPGRAVHGAFMAALGDGYATVVAARELIAAS
jgi:nicotinamidase-related amidase